MNSIIPIPRVPIKVREATLADLPFIDSLQKIHNKQVGFLHRETLEGKINLKHVIVAEESGERVGYCIGNDKYFKHENVGVIYQLNVAPGKQRNLVGAHLVGGMFDRAAYGCTLFCLWCAQDIQANFFWESIGFVPLAFRAGSRKRDRVHIFWEKRIRDFDPDVALIDSGEETARTVTTVLEREGLTAARRESPRHALYLSDRPASFQAIAERFLGRVLPPVEVVTVQD